MKKPKSKKNPPSPVPPEGPEDDLPRRHAVVGWWLLAAFVTLGLLLEALHGFKIGWYLDVSNQTRRFMWTLAHAHGTLLAVLNLVFASHVSLVEGWGGRLPRLASHFLLASTVLMPAGFFLAGFGIRGGDPGPAIFVAAMGGLLLVPAVFLTAAGAGRRK